MPFNIYWYQALSTTNNCLALKPKRWFDVTPRVRIFAFAPQPTQKRARQPKSLSDAQFTFPPKAQDENIKTPHWDTTKSVINHSRQRLAGNGGLKHLPSQTFCDACDGKQQSANESTMESLKLGALNGRVWGREMKQRFAKGKVVARWASESLAAVLAFLFPNIGGERETLFSSVRCPWSSDTVMMNS